MPKYKNVGKRPWIRPSGEVVAPGETFSATGREHDRIVRRVAYQARLHLVTAAAPSGGGKEQQEAAPSIEGGWRLKMAPDMYLKLHPKGGHAELAQQIVDGAAKEEGVA